MTVYKIEEAARLLDTVAISPETAASVGPDCMTIIDKLNDSMVGVVSFSGQTAWECHPSGDEFLYYLEGEAELTLLDGSGITRQSVRKGQAVRVAKGVWHTQRTRAPVRLMFITPVSGSQHSIGMPKFD